jgi:hypothetical protein
LSLFWWEAGGSVNDRALEYTAASHAWARYTWEGTLLLPVNNLIGASSITAARY